MSLLGVFRRPRYLFAAIAAGHIILISAQINSNFSGSFFGTVTFGAFAEAQRGISAVVDSATGWWRNYLALQTAFDDNMRLRQELSRTKIALQQEHSIAQQSRTFAELLGLRAQLHLATVAASVIAGSASADFRILTVDKGTTDGLGSDMAVIVPDGVVGRVIMPGIRAARVQLLVDRSAAVGAMVERTRVQGIAEGTGSNMLLSYVTAGADVVAGDVVVTSGNDGIYPKGFVIGQIESVERDAGSFGDIALRPAVDFSSVEAVLVVTTPFRSWDSEPVAGPEMQALE